MGKPSIATLLLLSVLVAVLLAVVEGGADASAAPSTICNVRVSELVKCIPALTGKKPPLPTKDCCSVLRKANLRCFCNYKSKLSKFGIDPTNAMALPGKCRLKLPGGCKK